MTTDEDKKRKVLMVFFSFPPTNSIAAVRLGKFAKYLPQFGWEPIVLTVDRVKGWPQDLPVEVDETNVVRTPFFALGSTISYRLTGGQKVVHQPAPEISRWKKVVYKLIRLMAPVYGLPVIRTLTLEPVGWYRPAVKKGLEILSEQKIDVIFSSYRPSISHFVASQLHKQSGIPWVAEFRDLWSLNHYLRKVQPFHFFEKELEKKVLKGSSLLVTVSEPAAKQLEALHSRKVVTVPNGFDGEDYLDNVPLTTKFTITYTGKIYPGKQDPSSLFKAIAELEEEGKISPNDFELRFFGSNTLATLLPLIQECHVNEFVKVYGFVPFKESIQKQKESTILLFLGWNDPEEKGVYTGKIFEYLGARRPILAIGLKGDVVDDLLQATRTGVVVNDVSEIKTLLCRWLEEFEQSERITSCFDPDSRLIRQYTRKQQSGKLAAILDEITKGQRPGGE